MKNHFRRVVTFFLLFFSVILIEVVSGQVLPDDNLIYKPNIKTVLLFKEGFEMSAPIMRLRSGESLRLSFDDLDGDMKHYQYTIIHCEADWTTSADLRVTDYLDGYNEDRIDDFEYSFNTTVHYTHYSLSFPSRDLRPKISGNYIMLVFLDDPSNVVFTRRFMITEATPLEITGNVHQASAIPNRYTHQEVDFTLKMNGMQINDPSREIKVVLMQDGRWDNAITSLKPRFYRSESLDYDYDNENEFPGGNEFRSFDIKSLMYQTERIKKITFDSGGNEVYLLDDQRRTFKNYVTDKEINGRKLIKNEDHVQNSDIQADYAWVHFSLPVDAILANGQLYLLGALTDWQLNDESKMIYDPDGKRYTKTLFLKQGYYNYLYVFRDNKTKRSDLSLIEGNHWETENEYTILVYYHENGGQYDRLIAVQDLNSIH